MLPARPNRLVMAWFDHWSRGALRRHFHRVHVYPETPGAWESAGAAFDPAVPRIYVANHSSFWDGVLLNHLVRRRQAKPGGRRRRQPLYCMIDEVQVRRHPFFRRLGGFSVDRTRPRDGLAALDYAANLLRGGASVVIFPQGAIRPNDERPLRFEPGVARLIERVPAARVVPVALRYEFWVEQRAEALVRWGAERTYATGESRARVLADLREWMEASLDVLKGHGLRHEPAPHVVLAGRRSISRWKDALPGRRRDQPTGGAPASPPGGNEMPA